MDSRSLYLRHLTDLNDEEFKYIVRLSQEVLYPDENDVTPKRFRGLEAMPVRDSKKDPKLSRNEPCTCGSGKKYKKCCLKD